MKDQKLQELLEKAEATYGVEAIKKVLIAIAEKHGGVVTFDECPTGYIKGPNGNCIKDPGAGNP